MKILKQETNKSCGVACIRSIMNYYGKNLSEKEVWKKHKTFGKDKNLRSPIISLGVTALKFGFKVEYINYNPILINQNETKDLKKALKIKSKKYFDFGKYYVDETLEFLDLGGKVSFSRLGIQEIKKILDKNKFVIIEIKPAFVNKFVSLKMNHKVILYGYNKKGFKILNPGNAKKQFWNFDKFLLAFYAAVPEMLIIKK